MGLQPEPRAVLHQPVTLKSLSPDVWMLDLNLALMGPAQPAGARHCPEASTLKGKESPRPKDT